MRIPKSPEDDRRRQRSQARANRGCGRCPCCGKTEGVTQTLRFCSFWGGLFYSKLLRADIFRCELCGAEWEGEPYAY